VCFLEEATFSSLSIRPSTKALHNLCLGQLCQPQRTPICYGIFGQVINRVGKNADFGHKGDKGFGKRAAHPNPTFLEVTPPPPPGEFESININLASWMPAVYISLS